MFKKISLLSFATLSLAFSANSASDFVWSNVSMGGGGFVSSVIASPVDENLFYARTDVGGAYRWDEASAKWVSLMDWVDVSERGLLGVEAIAVDPQESGKVYMVAGTSYWNDGRTAFLRSSDKGKSWEIIYTWDSTGVKGGAVTWFKAHGNGMGRGNGEALAIDPNNPDVMFYGSKNKGLWKSTDNGTSWSHVGAWTKAAGSDTTWNGSGFSFVQFAPGSSKVLYAGFLREGTKGNGFENVFSSTDGGATWAALPIPDSLRSTKGGSLVRLMPQRAVVSKDNSFLAVTFADGAGPHSMGWDEGWGMIYDGFGRGAVLRYDVKNKTWSDISPEDFIDEGKPGASEYDNADYSKMDEYKYLAPYGGISIDPNNSDMMIVTTEGYRGPQFWYTPTSDTSGTWKDEWGSNIYVTMDGGKTWAASFKYYWMEGGFYPTLQQMSENGIGWMKSSSIHWAGSVSIDPFNKNRVFVTSGNGVFRCDNILDYEIIPAGTYDSASNYYYSTAETKTSQVWKVSSHGIEETVPEEVVSIPGGPLVSVIGDYDGFRHDSVWTYPNYRHRTDVSGSSLPLGSTRGLAYASLGGKLVKVADSRSVKVSEYQTVPIEPLQFSADSGKTWTVGTYPNLDSSYKKGSVAISADGFVAVWSPAEGTSAVFRYANSAYTTVSGITNSAYVVGDPENSDVFYAYDKASGVFYKSADQGKTFAKVSEPGKSSFKKFRAIPGKEGELWLPLGVQDEKGNPKSGNLLHSTDGGATWSKASGAGYTEAVGYGIGPKGSGIALYAFTAVDGVTGVFESDDNGSTWKRVNDDGHEYGGLANGEFVMGDMNTYGVVYMSTAGRGIAARVPSTWKMGTSSSTSAISKPASSLLLSRYASLEGNILNLSIHNSRVNVAVFDLKGKRIFQNAYSSSTSLDLSETVRARGTYILRVTSGNAVLLSGKFGIVR